MTDWTQVITNLMLISGGAVVLVKMIDAGYKIADKKKNKALQSAVDDLKNDVAQLKKNDSDYREWLKKAEEHIDYIMKLLIDKNFKK